MYTTLTINGCYNLFLEQWIISTMIFIFIISFISILASQGLYVIFGAVLFLTPLLIGLYIAHSTSTNYYWMSCAALKKNKENKAISSGLALIRISSMAHCAITNSSVFEDNNLGMFMMHHFAHCKDQFCPISFVFSEIEACINKKDLLRGVPFRKKIADKINQAGDRFLKDATQANAKDMSLKLLYINFLIEYLENYTYVWFLIKKNRRIRQLL